MGVVLDSTVLITLERDRATLEEVCPLAHNENYFISVISASELLHGVHRAATIKIKQRRSAFVESIIARIPVLGIDLKISRSHALVWAELTKRGAMIGMNDSWIAATCIAHGFKLATANQKEFKRVPGLELA